MQHTRVRKIPSKPYPLPSEKWDDEWLRPALKPLKKMVAYLAEAEPPIAESSSGQPSKITYWSGLSGILGGILWIVLLFLLQLLPFTDDQRYCFDCMTPYDIGSSSYLLAIPMLFFLVSLIGLYFYAQHQLYPDWMGKLGGLVSLIGIALVIAHTLGKYWIEWFGYTGGFSGGRPHPLTLVWYASLGPGFTVFSAGLVLLAISTIKARLISSWAVILLIATSVAINLYAMELRWGSMLYGYERDARPYHYVIFTTLLVLFGISWIRLGNSLWRQSTKVLIHRKAK